jgi:hypothetical protein
MAGDFVNPKYYPESDTPIEQRLAEQFIIIYNNWKKGGELPDYDVDTGGIQSKSVASDAKSEICRDFAVEHPDAEDGN